MFSMLWKHGFISRNWVLSEYFDPILSFVSFFFKFQLFSFFAAYNLINGLSVETFYNWHKILDYFRLLSKLSVIVKLTEKFREVFEKEFQSTQNNEVLLEYSCIILESILSFFLRWNFTNTIKLLEIFFTVGVKLEIPPPVVSMKLSSTRPPVQEIFYRKIFLYRSNPTVGVIWYP